MHPHATVVARFWAKVMVGGPDDCWPWIAATNGAGYGHLRVGGRANGQWWNAHRYAFFLAYGYHPNICRHACDNPPCCNPAHLLDGTLKDNTADITARGRWDDRSQRLKGEGNGRAKLTDADVRAIRAAPTGYGKIKALAAQYGVSAATIGQIRNGRGWKHVP